MKRPTYTAILVIVLLNLLAITTPVAVTEGTPRATPKTSTSEMQASQTSISGLQQANVTSCIDITKPGYYIVSNNITGVQKDKDYCIGIFASNVVLDGRGYTLSSSWGIGIYVYQTTNTTIKNIKTTGYETGIRLIRSSNIKITSITASNHRSYGIYTEGSDYNVLTNVTASNNEYYGIYIGRF